MNTVRFEKTISAHIPALRDIYNYYVENTTATYYTHMLTSEEIEARLIFPDSRYSCKTISYGGKICGYGAIVPFNPKEGYARTAEISIYLDSSIREKGIGRQTLDLLETEASNFGLKVIIAAICSENTGSRRLFESAGYTECGNMKKVGFKFGRYLDTVYYQKIFE